MSNQNWILSMAVFMPMVGAIVSYLIGRKSKRLRDNFVCLIGALEVLLMVTAFLSGGAEGIRLDLPEVCGMGLHFMTDGFRVVYGAIAAFMWLMTLLFSKEYFRHYRNRNRYYLFQLITLGATEGVFLSADLYTTFIFFEIMSLASYVWVAQDERKESLRAAGTYLAVAIIGGLVMLMGLFLLYDQAGTLTIADLHQACKGKNVYVAAGCLFFGFGAKAGAFPLHIWLPKAHPVAPAPASALLSGILTKTGIFGALVISCQILLHDWKWGIFVLLTGSVTMFLGALLALFSIDFKRTLACSSVSQIGFILVGIGMQGILGEENVLAVRGTFLHMVNHSLFKLVLFMVAGVVYMNIHKLNLNQIRGFGRNKPLLAGIYLCGALGIGGIPLFSGYVSKTLIHESIVEYLELLREGHGVGILQISDIQLIEALFLISGGLTVAYMLKLFIAIFIEENTDPKVQAKYDALNKKYMSPLSAAVLTICAVLFPIMGTLPHLTMDKIADLGQGFMGIQENHHTVHYFALVNLKGGLISIGMGILIYLVIARPLLMKPTAKGDLVYANRWPKAFDLEDSFYRPILLGILPSIFGFICWVLDKLVDTLVKLLPLAGNVEAGIFDNIQDILVRFMKKTVYIDHPRPMEFDEGNILTYIIGRLRDKWKGLLNVTIRRTEPDKKEYVHETALAYVRFKENLGLISRSLSYGLIMFCIGFLITMVYMLYVLLR